MNFVKFIRTSGGCVWHHLFAELQLPLYLFNLLETWWLHRRIVSPKKDVRISIVNVFFYFCKPFYMFHINLRHGKVPKFNFFNKQPKWRKSHAFFWRKHWKLTFNTFIVIYNDYCDELELVKGRNRDLKLPLFGANIQNEKKLFWFCL